MKDPNKIFTKAFQAAEEGDYLKAEKLYRRLIKMGPEWDALATIHYNFGLVLMSLSKYYDAIKNFNLANKYKKTDENDWCKCLCLLNIKEWNKASDLFSKRYGKTRHSNTTVRFPDLPIPQIVNANDSKGLRLLVLNEQGLGDEILFTSQLHKLDKIVEKAHVQVSKDHLDLFNEIYNFENIELVCFESISPDSLEMYHCWAGLGDIFMSLYKNNESISLNTYKNTDSSKVGVCWSTNKESPNTTKRSIDPLTYFNIKQDLVSLQYGKNTEKVLGLDDYIPVNTLESWKKMEDLSVVVTVDTLIAHLAGLKGIPTLLVVNEHLDWRWVYRDKEDDRYSSFYPSVEIISVKDDIAEIVNEII